MTDIPPQQGAVDVQVLIDNLDKRGLLVIQAMLGKRAIDILEAEKPQKVPFLQSSKLLLPGQ